MDWISVNDRLPQDNSEVLIYAACGNLWKSTESALYTNGLFYFSIQEVGQDGTDLVTHWMPLPEPPTE